MTLLAQLNLLADSGLYFHVWRLANTPGECVKTNMRDFWGVLDDIPYGPPSSLTLRGFFHNFRHQDFVERDFWAFLTQKPPGNHVKTEEKPQIAANQKPIPF